MKERLNIWVCLPYLCCGIEVHDGVVQNSAPIMRWADGKQWPFVKGWITRKGGTWETF